MIKMREDTRKHADGITAIAFDYSTKLTTKGIIKEEMQIHKGIP